MSDEKMFISKKSILSESAIKFLKKNFEIYRKSSLKVKF